MHDFRDTIRHDWNNDNPDIIGIGHTGQRTKYRKKSRRRARRVLKQQLQKELQ